VFNGHEFMPLQPSAFEGLIQRDLKVFAQHTTTSTIRGLRRSIERIHEMLSLLD
jgi:hypothetical protein